MKKFLIGNEDNCPVSLIIYDIKSKIKHPILKTKIDKNYYGTRRFTACKESELKSILASSELDKNQQDFLLTCQINLKNLFEAYEDAEKLSQGIGATTVDEISTAFMETVKLKAMIEEILSKIIATFKEIPRKETLSYNGNTYYLLGIAYNNIKVYLGNEDGHLIMKSFKQKTLLTSEEITDSHLLNYEYLLSEMVIPYEKRVDFRTAVENFHHYQNEENIKNILSFLEE